MLCQPTAPINRCGPKDTSILPNFKSKGKSTEKNNKSTGTGQYLIDVTHNAILKVSLDVKIHTVITQPVKIDDKEYKCETTEKGTMKCSYTYKYLNLGEKESKK